MSKTRSLKQMVSNERGMTLIEIMVVIIIIAGLMAVLGNNVMAQYNKSKYRNSEIQMHGLLDAVHAYEMDCGQAPSAEVGLAALAADPGRDECTNWGPQAYVNAKQLKDSYGHEFLYELEDGNPIITFLGKDGRVGGTDLNRDSSTEDGARTQAQRE